MNAGIRWLGLNLLTVSMSFLASAAAAESRTSTPFTGVTLHQRTETAPRPLKINVVEIDLKAPGIRFRVTPPNGELPGETNLQTTREFLIQQKAQIAVNLSFYKLVKGKYGDTVGLTSPFFCDYGGHIELGEKVFFHFNCVVLDVCQVTIGSFTLFGVLLAGAMVVAIAGWTARRLKAPALPATRAGEA